MRKHLIPMRDHYQLLSHDRKKKSKNIIPRTCSYFDYSVKRNLLIHKNKCES